MSVVATIVRVKITMRIEITLVRVIITFVSVEGTLVSVIITFIRVKITLCVLTSQS
jgi:hypothetical protein